MNNFFKNPLFFEVLTAGDKYSKFVTTYIPSSQKIIFMMIGWLEGVKLKIDLGGGWKKA